MLVSQLPILPTIIILLLLGQVVHIIDASETVHPRTQPKPFGLNHKTNHKIYSSSTARRNNNNIQQPIVPIEEKPVWYPSDPFSQDDDDDDPISSFNLPIPIGDDFSIQLRPSPCLPVGSSKIGSYSSLLSPLE